MLAQALYWKESGYLMVHLWDISKSWVRGQSPQRTGAPLGEED